MAARVRRCPHGPVVLRWCGGPGRGVRTPWVLTELMNLRGMTHDAGLPHQLGDRLADTWPPATRKSGGIRGDPYARSVAKKSAAFFKNSRSIRSSAFSAARRPDPATQRVMPLTLNRPLGLCKELDQNLGVANVQFSN